MRIDGEWLLFDDDILRPVIRGEILTEAGAWQQAEFLVDTGADRTVFSAATAPKIGLQASDHARFQSSIIGRRLISLLQFLEHSLTGESFLFRQTGRGSQNLFRFFLLSSRFPVDLPLSGCNWNTSIFTRMKSKWFRPRQTAIDSFR